MAKRAAVMRFHHFRTWTSGRAVPVCDPGPTIVGPGAAKYKGVTFQTTPDQNKVTCGSCIERLKGAGLWTIA